MSGPAPQPAVTPGVGRPRWARGGGGGASVAPVLPGRAPGKAPACGEAACATWGCGLPGLGCRGARRSPRPPRRARALRAPPSGRSPRSRPQPPAGARQHRQDPSGAARSGRAAEESGASGGPCQPPPPTGSRTSTRPSVPQETHGRAGVQHRLQPRQARRSGAPGRQPPPAQAQGRGAQGRRMWGDTGGDLRGSAQRWEGVGVTGRGAGAGHRVRFGDTEAGTGTCPDLRSPAFPRLPGGSASGGGGPRRNSSHALRGGGPAPGHRTPRLPPPWGSRPDQPGHPSWHRARGRGGRSPGL